MLIHVEANQFFLNSIQIIHDVQANQFFLDSSIQIVQNGRGDEVSPLSRKVSPQLVRGLHIPIPLSLLFFLFFRGLPRVISRNSAPWINTRTPLTHPPMHPSLATGPFDFRNFRLIVFEALLPGSRGHFHFLAPEIFHFHRRPRLGGNRDGGGLSSLFPEGLELVRWIWFEFRGNCARMII